VAFLVRKVSRAKWDPSPALEKGEISADAVTGDLRTTGNTLSFWRCETASEAELEGVFLALAAVADDVATMDIAWIEESEVIAAALPHTDTPGRTPVASMIDRHVDLERLSLRRLSVVAELLSSSIAHEKHKRLPRAKITRLLADAVKRNLVELDQLQDRTRAAVERLGAARGAT